MLVLVFPATQYYASPPHYVRGHGGGPDILGGLFYFGRLLATGSVRFALSILSISFGVFLLLVFGRK